jgi:hypothetical protein
MHVRVSEGPASGGGHESVRMELCNALEHSPAGCGWPRARRNLRAEPEGTAASPATFSGKQVRRSPYIPPIDPPQLVRITAVSAPREAGHNRSRSLCRICAGAYSADAERAALKYTGLTATDCECAGRQLLRQIS